MYTYEFDEDDYEDEAKAAALAAENLAELSGCLEAEIKKSGKIARGKHLLNFLEQIKEYLDEMNNQGIAKLLLLLIEQGLAIEDEEQLQTWLNFLEHLATQRLAEYFSIRNGQKLIDKPLDIRMSAGELAKNLKNYSLKDIKGLAGIAEVDVDKLTGKISVNDYVAVVDCGTVINTNLARIQTEGGIAQGIGMALFEDISYTPKGMMRNNSFMQFKIPTRLDVGSIRVAFESSYEDNGPFQSGTWLSYCHRNPLIRNYARSPGILPGTSVRSSRPCCMSSPYILLRQPYTHLQYQPLPKLHHYYFYL